MSLCVILMTPDQLLMGADSRACVNFNGTTYAVDDDVQKIHLIGNKIIFFGGLQITGEMLIEEIKKINNPSISTIVNIAKNIVSKFAEDNKDVDFGDVRLLDVTIGTMENGKPIVYNFSSYDNYALKVIESKPFIRTIVVGSHKPQAMKMTNELLNKIDNVFSLYENVYSSLASEEMGGTLSVYVLHSIKKTIYSKNIAIKDNRPILRLDESQLYVQNVITQENGVQVFDENNIERLQMGEIGVDKYGFKVNYANGNIALENSSNGNICTYDESGNLTMDSNGLNPRELSGFGVVSGLTIGVFNVNYVFQLTTTVSSDAAAGTSRLYLNNVSGITTNNAIVFKDSSKRTKTYLYLSGIGSNYVDLYAPLPYTVLTGTTVCVVSTTVRNGSICNIVVKQGTATLPNGKYITISSDQTFSSVDCMASASDFDGYEFRVVWLGSDGIIRYASAGTSGTLSENYPEVYTARYGTPDNPRTTNLGAGTNTPDGNAVILGCIIVGWHLGQQIPQVLMSPYYRDERPIKVERNVGTYGKTIFAGSSVVSGSSKVSVELIGGNSHLATVPLGYGIKCAFVSVQRCSSDSSVYTNPSEYIMGGFIIARLIDSFTGGNFGTTALEISSSPKIVQEFYNDSTEGYILSQSALNTNYIKLRRAWLEVAPDKQTYLQLSFYSSSSESVFFRLFWSAF